MFETERRGSRGPMRRVLPDHMREALERAASDREQAERNYFAAIMDAHYSGATNSAIAEAVGRRPETIRQIIARNLKHPSDD